MTIESSKELQTGELSTRLLFNYGDVEEKPH